MNSNDIFVVNKISLRQWWLNYQHSDNEERNLFLYMDFAMKYIHERGYYIQSFDIDEIEILNNSIELIKFKKVEKIPYGLDKQSELIKNNVYDSSLLQVSLYIGEMNLNPNFIKENFEEIIPFLPEIDIGYYRGILQRGADIYFTDFELERIKRDITSLEKNLSSDTKNDKSFKELSMKSKFTNDKNNAIVYRELNSVKDGAFLNILVYPMIFVILVAVFVFIVFLGNIFFI